MRLVLAALLFATPAKAQDVALACSGWQASMLGISKVNFEASKALKALEGAGDAAEVIEAKDRIIRAILEIEDVKNRSDTLRASVCPSR
jgi:hypothetical protein